MESSSSVRFRVNCITSLNSRELVNGEKAKNPMEIITNSIINALKALRKTAIAAVLLGLLLMYDPNFALAASGGRMGGRSFSSRSSKPSSSSSMRYSTRRSSYSVGNRLYDEPAVGGEVIVISITLGPWLGVGMFLLVISLTVLYWVSDRSGTSVLTDSEKASVVKFQVGLRGMGRGLQRDLNRIAESADTSTPEGLSYVLTETILALLRHPDYYISGYSSMDLKRSIEDGEKHFDQLSIEEREKFDEETLVNVNNIKRRSTTSQKTSGFSNEYIVVTILVAVDGVLKLPTINGSGDLKEALQNLASIPSSKILAVEVLWTPQNENDTLSERELLKDYPLLRPL